MGAAVGLGVQPDDVDDPDLLADAVTSKLHARLTFQRRPTLSAAVFGADAGVVGAGLLGWEQFGEVGPGFGPRVDGSAAPAG